MLRNSLRRNIFILFVLITLTYSSIISLQAIKNSTSQDSQLSQQPIFFTEITNITDYTNSDSILNQLGVPGFSRKHGFNYISYDGWSCRQDHGPVLKFWEAPSTRIGSSLASSEIQTRQLIKEFYRSSGVKLLVNVFSTYENPVTDGLDPVNCSISLLAYIKEYGFDGVNIDFRDKASFKGKGGLSWITNFMLNFQSSNISSNMIVSHSIDVGLFDGGQYPTGDYSIIQKAVGKEIDFYNVRYATVKSNFTNYDQIFQTGVNSVNNLVRKGVPINKIVIAKPSIFNQIGFVRPQKLLKYFKRANLNLNWWGGAMFSPYIPQQSRDQTRLITLRRDNIEVISAVNLDSVNSWWPPEKTVAQIGVPKYSSNNLYNTFIFGTWTCKNGAFDVAKLWSDASFYLSTNFGNTTSAIQSFLKQQYSKKGKSILIRAFGSAQSPTTANLDAKTCAKNLASFIKANLFDGADINYQDNVAFNNGFAENWLITFTNSLRDLLPFHLISHSIQNYHLDRSKYKGGSYTRVISSVSNLLDFYNILYYGQQQTAFKTFNELFQDSGAQFKNISITNLISAGFDINKIVIGKPTRLSDTVGVGFIQPASLRAIFLQANKKFGWRGGICYSTFISDQKGQSVLALLRGMNVSDSIRFAYVDNVNTWWPPKITLGQMGAPTLSVPNIYNYFAYSFWTCKGGPLAISKVYNDPITYFGTELGGTKQTTQKYIKDLFEAGQVKLMISAFGASENPVHQSLDPIFCANKFNDFLNSNLIDGFDIDFQDSDSFKNGTGEIWLSTFMRQMRKSRPFDIVSHAPQGPYFSPNYTQTKAYLTLHQSIGKYIDFYNIQFYNQLDATYQNYTSLFIDSGNLYPNCSLFQIIQHGIEPSKIVLGKPATKKDVYNTGYVASTDLKNLLKKVMDDKQNPGWKPSIMLWQYLSDQQGKIISEVMSYNK